MNEIIFGELRIQFLSKGILRLEKQRKGHFCDEKTLVVPAREQLLSWDIEAKSDNNEIAFLDYRLILPKKGNTLRGLRLKKNGKTVYHYKKISNSGELPPLGKAGETFALMDSPRILLPKGGYTYHGNIKNNGYGVEEDADDLYLFLCEKSDEALRSLYVQLTGRIEMPPLSVFGCWNSKYYKHTEESAKNVIKEYHDHQIPLDYLVLDTDWRISTSNGIGYEVNTELFPDMKRFINFAHSEGVKIMFNDHPEPVKGAKSVFDPKEVRYREEKLQSLLDYGLDIWWYDRNWTTKLISPTKGVNPETLGLYLFSEITSHYRKKEALEGKPYRRPTIMANVDNILNGLYLGIASSASHRYGLQWTGDIMSDPDALRQEISNLVRAGNNLIAYVNADCGGHQGNPDKEWFIRWMQFGVFSPIFRPHCSDLVTRTREPWAYDRNTCDIVREYINCRYRLLPLIYQGAHEAYEKGTPVYKALGWNYPKDKKALACDDEYMLGKDILIAPIAGSMIAPLSKKHYVGEVKATYFDGLKCEGAPLAEASYDKLEMRCNFNSPEKGVPVFNFSAFFETDIRFDEDAKLILRCDDGAFAWLDGVEVLHDDSLHSAKNFDLAELKANKTYHLKIQYFQAGGEAECTLHYVRSNAPKKKSVYLPHGKWMDVFSGKIYLGGRTIARDCSLEEMPLFVRLGALLPLAFEAKNTKEQKWDKLVFDFYPDKTSSDGGCLYEDDTLTTAYQEGGFRISPYEASYSEEENAYVVVLRASKGSFEGEKFFSSREITFKCHLLHKENVIKKVTVNGQDHEFILVKRKPMAFPFNAQEGARDGDVATLSFSCSVHESYEIKFFLK